MDETPDPVEPPVPAVPPAEPVSWTQPGRQPSSQAGSLPGWQWQQSPGQAQWQQPPAVQPSWGPPPAGPPVQYGPGGPPPQYGPNGYGQYGQYGQPNYGPGWGGYQHEYKPGIVPLRPLSVGEVLDGSFATIRRHPRVVFGVAAVLAIVAELIRLGVGWSLNNVSGTLGASSISTQNKTQSAGAIGGSLVTSAVNLIVTALCGALLAGVVTGVVSKAILGQRVDGAEVLGAVRKRWLGLLAVSVLAELLPFSPVLLLVGGILLGQIALGLGIVGGILGGAAVLILCPLLWGRLALAVPIFVLERQGPGRAIARSWRLVRGAFWRVWGLRALVSLIVTAASAALTLPVVLLLVSSVLRGDNVSTTALVLLAITGALIWMLTQPVVASALTLIYVDRRMRAEGLDIQLTQAARAADASPAGQL
jgi:hypothetical protein